MNETPANPIDPKSQVIEKLKAVNSVLVTVSANPSVDQLAACIAVTMALNKLGKSATAVFSGKVPSVLEFLHPGNTLQATTDSLRDFIIAIDKSKADKLRYKLEDDVVKIFITPYKTSITEADLKFSAGDFNVELVLALGVKHQQDLDAAITAHGRIFHDAVIMSVNDAPGGDFGEANWEDLDVSSLSEQVTDLIEALDSHALDGDIATALLTGIVAETSRFSNARTRPSTLTTSAILLSAGADQQLVNAKLQELIGTVVDLQAGDEIAPTIDDPSSMRHDVAEELVIDENGAFQQIKNEIKSAPVSPAPKPLDGKPLQAVRLEDATAQPSTPTEAPRLEVAPAPQPAPRAATLAVPLVADDAEAARRAVESALNGISAPASAAPVVEPPSAPAPQNPLVTSIPAHQPSYSNPATMTNFDGPAPTSLPQANEPAPLSMSPADQAFTMPLPPTSSIPTPAERPVFPPAPTPQTPAGNAPPPLPPPMMPAV